MLIKTRSEFVFIVTTNVKPIQLPIQWGSGALSLRVKQPGREADHSPPTSGEIKKIWIYTSTPPYVFMA
jgi:hypothetical protein